MDLEGASDPLGIVFCGVCLFVFFSHVPVQDLGCHHWSPSLGLVCRIVKVGEEL